MRVKNRIGSRMADLGISNGFLANRLYSALNYDSPAQAEAFITKIKQSAGFSKHFRIRDTSKCDERKREFDRKVEIIEYALGFSQSETKYEGYPPKGGVSNETITSFLNALNHPANASLETLLKLEVDEKLRILSAQGYQNVIDAINNQINREYPKR